MTGATWRCPDCDEYNDAADAVCHTCETKRPVLRDARTRTGTSAPKTSPKPAPKPGAGDGARKPAPKPGAGKKPPAKRPATAGGKGTGKRTGAKPAAPKKAGWKPDSSRGRVTPLAPDIAARLAEASWLAPDAAGTVRASRELAVLLPELFNPDGTIKRDPVTGDPLVPLHPAVARRTPPRDRPGTRVTAPAGPHKTTPSAPATPVTPEFSRSDTILGCSCVLVIAAAVITAIVLLILNWGSVAHHLGLHKSAGGSSAAASPKPASPKPATVAPGTPCPKTLAALVPSGGGPGSVLVAAYRTADSHEKYAFCRTKAGKLYYFGRDNPGKFTGSGVLAQHTSAGYVFSFPPETFHIQGETITDFVNGKKKWSDKLVSESSVS